MEEAKQKFIILQDGKVIGEENNYHNAQGTWGDAAEQADNTVTFSMYILVAERKGARRAPQQEEGYEWCPGCRGWHEGERCSIDRS